MWGKFRCFPWLVNFCKWFFALTLCSSTLKVIPMVLKIIMYLQWKHWCRTWKNDWLLHVSFFCRPVFSYIKTCSWHSLFVHWQTREPKTKVVYFQRDCTCSFTETLFSREDGPWRFTLGLIRICLWKNDHWSMNIIFFWLDILVIYWFVEFIPRFFIHLSNYNTWIRTSIVDFFECIKGSVNSIWWSLCMTKCIRCFVGRFLCNYIDHLSGFWKSLLEGFTNVSWTHV